MQDGGLDRLVLVAPRKQIALGPRQTPKTAQDAEQLLGQHDVTFLTALAPLDPHDHPVAVDVGDLEARQLRNPQACAIGRGQCDAGLEVGDRFEEAKRLRSIPKKPSSPISRARHPRAPRTPGNFTVAFASYRCTT